MHRKSIPRAIRRLQMKRKGTTEKKAETAYQYVLENASVSKARKEKIRVEQEKLDVLSLHKKLTTLKAKFIEKLKK